MNRAVDEKSRVLIKAEQPRPREGVISKASLYVLADSLASRSCCIISKANRMTSRLD